MHNNAEEQQRISLDDDNTKIQTRRKGELTHCVGSLVICELHQSWAVFWFPGFGSHSVTTQTSLCVHAAARVLPDAAWAAASARRDVLLVGACPDGCRSVLRRKRSQEWGDETPAFHLTPSVLFGLSLSAWHWAKCFRKLNAKVILIYLYLLMRLMCCLAFVLILFVIYLLSTLLLTFSAVSPLIHVSLISQTPPSLHQHRLVLIEVTPVVVTVLRHSGQAYHSEWNFTNVCCDHNTSWKSYHCSEAVRSDFISSQLFLFILEWAISNSATRRLNSTSYKNYVASQTLYRSLCITY